MNVLVSGSSGMILTGIIPELLRRAHSVRLLSRDGPDASGRWNRVEPFAGDVDDPASLRGSAGACDGVVHIGSFGVGNVLAEAARPGVQRFVSIAPIHDDVDSAVDLIDAIREITARKTLRRRGDADRSRHSALADGVVPRSGERHHAHRIRWRAGNAFADQARGDDDHVPSDARQPADPSGASDLPGGVVRFEIEAYSRAANRIDFAALRTMGEGAQSANWRIVVQNVIDASGGSSDGVHVGSLELTDDQAARVERDVRAMVRQREREESASPERPA